MYGIQDSARLIWHYTEKKPIKAEWVDHAVIYQYK